MAKILVVGGAGGVGSAVVRKLLARGDEVSVTVLNDQEEVFVKANVGAVAAFHRVDCSDADGVRETLARVLDGADVDAVLVCAGISPNGPVETTPLAKFRRTLEINTLTEVAVYQAAMPALRRSKGRLLFLSSMAGRVSMPFLGVYTISKYALEGIADAMRREAQPQGVSVILVEPGGIKTSMVTDQLKYLEPDLAALPAEHQARYAYLYRAFGAMASKSHAETSSSAELVADIVVGALEDPVPRARYVAGADAEELLGLAAATPDAEMDKIFRDMYAAASA